jgi:alkanesulfonate monooxygenase SsuD/methylene tetrahydromethanopterin reductase-like flavin-dependent oxidoreductase (luciferase family)
VHVGVAFPIWGEAIERHGVEPMVELVRAADVDGLWVGDHVVLSHADGSAYPGKASGRFFLEPTAPWFEAMTTLGYIAAVAGPLHLGLSVALPLLRPPVLFAKQVATLTRLAPSGVTLGVGIGWQRTEFAALAVPWEGRGARLDASIEVMRECWTGEPRPGRYHDFEMPAGITCYPTPPAPPPVLIGGSSPRAFERVARLGDGWIGALQGWDGGVEAAAGQLAGVRRAWALHRADSDGPRLALVTPIPRPVARRSDLGDLLAERLAAYAQLGLDTIILGFSWTDLDAAAGVLEHVRNAASTVQTRSLNDV